MKYLSSYVELAEKILVQYDDDEEKRKHIEAMVQDGWKCVVERRNMYYWFRIGYRNEVPEELLNTVGGDNHDDVGNP